MVKIVHQEQLVHTYIYGGSVYQQTIFKNYVVLKLADFLNVQIPMFPGLLIRILYAMHAFLAGLAAVKNLEGLGRPWVFMDICFVTLLLRYVHLGEVHSNVTPSLY